MDMSDFLGQFALLDGDPGGWWRRDIYHRDKEEKSICVGIGMPAACLGGCFFRVLASGYVKSIEARSQIGISVEI